MRYPIGRLRWTVQNNQSADFGVCGLKNGQVHILTFSDCHPDKFSCNNGQWNLIYLFFSWNYNYNFYFISLKYIGQCIEINNKCNGVVDCADGTDELECEFLILDKNYSKNKLPLPNAQALKDEPVKVYFSITMTSYPRIDASHSRWVILNQKSKNSMQKKYWLF